MFNFLMAIAENPVTPWVILSGITIMILVEAWKVSPQALMGDIFAEGLDE